MTGREPAGGYPRPLPGSFDDSGDRRGRLGSSPPSRARADGRGARSDRGEAGPEPNNLELAMFSVMWSEHCGYKCSRPLLRPLPTEKDVIAGPGENAGVMRIGDGWASRSRSSPTTIRRRWSRTRARRPGSAGSSVTSSPWARGRSPSSMRSASATPPIREPGTSSTGSCAAWVAMATASASRRSAARSSFDPSYKGNPLVNVMAIGLVREDAIMRAAAPGPGNLVILVRLGHRARRDRRCLGPGLGDVRRPGPLEAACGAGW